MNKTTENKTTEKKTKKIRRSSITVKAYFYVGITVFTAAIVVALITFQISATQIDNYFKELSRDSAKYYASIADVDFFRELRETVETDEYQALRKLAEENDDESLIEEYLKEKGLWEGYVKARSRIGVFLKNMRSVRYLYVIAAGDVDATEDLFLLDDFDEPMYFVTGRYEEREPELLGVDFSHEIEPTISKGEWGWLCSSFVPVYDSQGRLICQVGCDVEMSEIMGARWNNFFRILLAAVCATIIILIGATMLIRNRIIDPLHLLAKEMKKFSPSKELDYDNSGVMNLELKNHDEIEEIYNEIRSMQVRILDYLRDITTIQKEKEKAESDVKEKAKEIDQISLEAYKDALTDVGNKVAYLKKTSELMIDIKNQTAEFALVMIDVNRLKVINDRYGHAAGDEYIVGCCKTICRIYKLSPVYRVGGDEFIVILTGKDYDEREKKLKELRESFDMSYKRTDLNPWQRYSAAAGMAEFSDKDLDVESVFDRADRAMYAEKDDFKRNN